MWFGDEEQLEAAEGEDRLFVEWSWRTPDPDAEDDGEGDDHDCILNRFANDRETDPGLAGMARQWFLDSRWGLWMLKYPRPMAEPGVWLVELLTGARIYASIPPEQLEGMPDRAVLLGQFGPLDGVWRSGGAFYVLSPSEADRLAAEIWSIAGVVAREGAGLPKKHAAKLAEGPYGGLPPSAAADAAPPPPVSVCRMLSSVVAASFPHLLAVLERSQSSIPHLKNMDGHDTLLIKAEIAVDEPEAVWARLGASVDFEGHDEHLNWLGPPMSPAQVATAHAEIVAVAKSKGSEPPPFDDMSQRWSRGSVNKRDSLLVLDVNSTERLEMFLDILTDLGERPQVISKTTIDPAQDFALGRQSQPRPPSAGAIPEDAAHEVARALEKGWLQERVPALEGMTPAQAAQSERGRFLLEALLRDFEYREAAASSPGGVTMSAASLRKQLNM